MSIWPYPDTSLSSSGQSLRPIPRMPTIPQKENPWAARKRAMLMTRMEDQGPPMMGPQFLQYQHSPMSGQRAAAIAARDLGTSYQQELPNFTAQDAGDYEMQRRAPDIIQGQIDLQNTQSKLPWEKVRQQGELANRELGLQETGMNQDNSYRTMMGQGQLGLASRGMALDETRTADDIGYRRASFDANQKQQDVNNYFAEKQMNLDAQFKKGMMDQATYQNATNRLIAEKGAENQKLGIEVQRDIGMGEVANQGQAIQSGERLGMRGYTTQENLGGMNRDVNMEKIASGERLGTQGLGIQDYNARTDRQQGWNNYKLGNRQLNTQRDLGFGQQSLQRDQIGANYDLGLGDQRIKREGIQSNKDITLASIAKNHSLGMAQLAQQERQIDANFAMSQQEKQDAKIQLRVQSAVEQLDKYSDPAIAGALDVANTPFKRTFDTEDIQNLATFRDIVKRNLDTISMYDPETANQMKLKLAESVIPALEGITSPSFNRKWNSRWAPMFGNSWTRAPGKNLKQAQTVSSEIQQMLMPQ